MSITTDLRATRIHVTPPDCSLFDPTVTVVEVEDEAAGEFVIVRSMMEGAKPGEVRITPEEWPALRDAINRMVGECRP